jgi:hypothetical protein
LKLITISIKLKFCSKYNNFYLQSNLSYVTFQENSEIWSHKTGGHLIQDYPYLPTKKHHSNISV